MNLGSHLADTLTAIITVAVIYVLVRPQSAGAQLVQTLSNGLVTIVSHAADLAAA